MVNVSGPLKIVSDSASRATAVIISAPHGRPSGDGMVTGEAERIAPTAAGNVSFTAVPGPILVTLVADGEELEHWPGIVPDKASATLAEVVDAARLATGETQESLAAFVQQVLAVRQEVLGVADDVATEKDAALSGISTLRDAALGAIDNARSGSLSQISTARSDALSQISQNSASALTDAGTAKDTALTAIGDASAGALTGIDTAESGALAAIGAEVDRAEDAAARAEAVADSTHWQDDRLSVMGQLGPSLRGPRGDKGIQGPKGDQGDSGDGSGDVLWSELDPVLDGKANASHTHTKSQITDLESIVAYTAGNAIVKRTSDGTITVPESPSSFVAATSKRYVDNGVGKKADASRVTALEGSQPIIVSSLPGSPLPGRIYLVTG